VVVSRGEENFGTGGLKLSLLLIASGFVTALPLLLFASATRRLSVVGFMMYINPLSRGKLRNVYNFVFTQTSKNKLGATECLLPPDDDDAAWTGIEDGRQGRGRAALR
jgi:hypothetical protein